MHEKDLRAWLQKHGELREAEAITYTPPQPSPEEQAILQKMRDLAARAGEQLNEPEQEPVRRTHVYDLLSSAKSLSYQAKGMARADLREHIDGLRVAQGFPPGKPDGNPHKDVLGDVIPQEEVIIILEDPNELSSTRRFGTNPVFQHKKEMVGTHHLQEPGEVGIHPRRVNLVLRVDSGNAEPLPAWFPRAFPQATVVNIRRGSQPERQ